MAVVKVEDDGPGIPEESAEHLMKPFTVAIATPTVASGLD